MFKSAVRRRRMKMKEPLSSHHQQSMAQIAHCHNGNSQQPHHPHHHGFSTSKLFILLFCSFLTLTVESASVVKAKNDNNREDNYNYNHNSHHLPLSHYHHFLDQHNEYDSSSGGVSILDDDTVRLKLAIDDDSSAASVPSLRFLEPKVYLRVSGESGMIRPIFEDIKDEQPNEVVANNNNANYERNFQISPSSDNRRREKDQGDLHFESHEESPEIEDFNDDDEDDEMNDNFHLHFPYIESFREKYTKLDSRQFTVTTTPPPPPSTTLERSSSNTNNNNNKERLSKQEWSEIIAQVTTPSSFNEINSSASEHRLADFHLRANLPSYFYSNEYKYPSYTEDDLENVADLDDEHSKYFVKTRPRSVSTAGSSIYNNFYYEPPSFSTKSVPIPVKTNKEKVIFASIKPTQHPHPHNFFHHHHEPDYHDGEDVVGKGGNFIPLQFHHENDDEQEQQDAPIVTNNATPPTPTFQMNYGKEANKAKGASGGANYYKNEQNFSSSNNNSNKSSAETLDVSTSQSVVSKVTLNNLNNPYSNNGQFVVIKSDLVTKTTLADDHDENVDTPQAQAQAQHSFIIHQQQSGLKHESDRNAENGHFSYPTEFVPTPMPIMTTTMSPVTVTDPSSPNPTSEPNPATTTDATSIPGIPGVDYPILGEIPQTDFDCQKQRYKGFFADIDSKCQAWHYCDFTDSHSTFLCPNGTLFSQVLLTCDWWFNVDCKQARQLYVLNERLYRYIKPPKPSFPEDFIGEHVDKWLLQQFTDGYLPKVRKKSKAKFLFPPPPPSSPTSSEAPPPEKNNN